MTPISQMTVGEAISSVRDILFVFGMVVLGWKGRGWIQPVFDFFDKADKFIDSTSRHMSSMESTIRTMEGGMQTLLNNHLSHIEADLKYISGRDNPHVVSLRDDPQEPIDTSAEV